MLSLTLALCGGVFAESAPETIRAALPNPQEKATRVERAAEPAKEVAPAELKLQPSRVALEKETLPGERLIYDIRVNGIPAGKAELEVRKVEKMGGEEGPLVWVVDYEVRSNRAVSLYYDVKIAGRTRIDVKGGFSRSFHVKRREGEVRGEEQIGFNYEIGNMHATYERARYDKQDKEHPDGVMKQYQPIPLPGKVLDPLSALYYIRSMDIKTLIEKGLPICADRRVWNTKFKLSPKGASFEDVGKLKNRKCVAIEPQAEFKGLFERKGKMTIWLDEATRIPLKMTVEIPIGTADVELSEFYNSPLNEEPDKR
ncbi:MAG TPA: DUF3108 domain-containing protein [Planctomycetota bacterium]|nr:DUF3108 domain-containing protein [Planctomycetota bacterium]